MQSARCWCTQQLPLLAGATTCAFDTCQERVAGPCLKNAAATIGQWGLHTVEGCPALSSVQASEVLCKVMVLLACCSPQTSSSLRLPCILVCSPLLTVLSAEARC